MKALKLLAVAVLGYVGYEAFQAYKRHRVTTEGPMSPNRYDTQGQLHEALRPKGEPVTGGGGGSKVRTLNRDGESTSTVVGRGVVSRR